MSNNCGKSNQTNVSNKYINEIKKKFFQSIFLNQKETNQFLQLKFNSKPRKQ